MNHNGSRQSPVYVYLIESTSGHFKIGMSSDPKRRLGELKKTQGPYDYFLILSIPQRDREAAKDLERVLHADFEQRCVKGEWFELNARDLLDLGHIAELHMQAYRNYV